MSKFLDSTGVSWLFTKLKSVFLTTESGEEVDTITVDQTPVENSTGLVTSGGVYTALSGKQDTLVSGTNLKTINSTSLLGSGDITISGGSGDTNVIEAVTFNGTAATITNKTAAITATIPTKVSDLTNDSGFTTNTGTITGITMNGSSKGTSGVVDLGTVITAHQDISGKANAADLATVATSGSYTDLSNKPTIPSAPGTLNTTATTAQSTSSSEALSGSVTLHKVAKTGTYSDLIGTPTIPSKVSDLTNDSGFITNAGVTSFNGSTGAVTYSAPVSSVNGSTGAVTVSTPGTLNTTATTAQSTSSSEALSGSITLHKVSKTGTYSDLIGTPTIPTSLSDLTDDVISGNYVPLAGGTMDQDADLTFLDYDSALMPSLNSSYTHNSTTVEADGVEVKKENFTPASQMVSGVARTTTTTTNYEASYIEKEVKVVESGTTTNSYTLTIPSKTGTLAVTSDIPTVSGVYAPLASPALTGTPTAPTAAKATDSTQIATTAFVHSVVGDYLPLTGGTIHGDVSIFDSTNTYGVEITQGETTSGLTVRADSDTTVYGLGTIENYSATLTLPQTSGTLALTSQIPTKVSDLTNDSGFLTSHQDISGKANVTATVSTVTYDTTNKKLQKTINGTTTDIVTASTIVTDGGGLTSHQDISGKANLSGATFTGAVTGTSSGNTAQFRNITISTSDPSGGNDGDVWIKISS